MTRVLTWFAVAAFLILLLATREHLPSWLQAYNREAARLDDDLEQLSQP